MKYLFILLLLLSACTAEITTEEQSEYYIACGCGCCIFAEPLEEIAEEQCIPEGTTLEELKEKDTNISTDFCAHAGCSFPIKYVAC